jgi:uncharacterized tellurite resistance protein B-like protein
LSYLPLVITALIVYFLWKYLTRSKVDASNKTHGPPVPEPEPRALRNPPPQPAEEIDKDAWEGWFIGEASDPKPAKARLQIAYVDGDGKSTERTIEVIEFDNSPANSKTGLIMAYCEMRNARRTFRYDRITHAVDMETGEVINSIQDYLRKVWSESTAHSMEQFEEQFQGPLEILLFIARADGRLVAKERAAIIEFCRTHLPDQRVTDEQLTKSIKEVRALTLQSFKVAVGRLLKQSPDLTVELIKTGEMIVAAEKSVHPAEVEALEYLKRRLAESIVGKA